MTSLVQPVDWLAVAPPLAVALLAIGLLVVDLLAPRLRPWLGWVAAAGLLLAAVPLWPLAGSGARTFCLPVAGPPACSYVVDPLTVALQVVVLAGTAVVALLAVHAVHAEDLPAGEHWFLLLSSAAGALVLAAARDVLTLVVALEVVSLPAFALVGLRRHDPRASEAALKLFLVSVVSTAVTLYGLSLLYGATGEVHLERLGAALAGAEPAPVLTAGAVLAVAGFGFKVAAVPFHAWAPEAYAGAPLPVAAYLSVVSKTAGFAGLLVLLVVGLAPYADRWGPVLAVVAAATMTVGNLGALRQRSAVRLLAWSSIAQSGYVLVPFATVAVAPVLAVSATVAYLLAYAAMNLTAFAAVALTRLDRPGATLDDFRGLARTRPRTAAVLAFALVCLAGLPPGLVGLFAKVVVFAAPVAAGLWWLALVMAANVVVGLAYYLAWAVRLVAAPEPVAATAAGSVDGAVPGAPGRPTRAGRLGVRTAATVTCAAAVGLSLAPEVFTGALLP